MDVHKAYELRDELTDTELERLEQGLRDQVERYRFITKNTTPERSSLEKSFLAKLEAKLDDVRGLRAERAKNSN